jgi:hypothetical protein
VFLAGPVHLWANLPVRHQAHGDRITRVFDNNKFCKKNGDTPVDTKGGGILLLGATHTLVTHNSVTGNSGKKINSGGIVVLSAKPLSHGSNPEFDTISFNSAFRNRPADLIWDHTGFGVRFRHNVDPGRVLLATRLAVSAPGAVWTGR